MPSQSAAKKQVNVLQVLLQTQNETNKGHKPSERGVQTQNTSVDNPKQEKWRRDTGGAHLLLLEAAYLQSDGADR